MSQGTAHLLTALAALGRMAAANEIGMVTSTLDGVRDANDAFLRLTGNTRADLEAGGIHWRQLTAPEWTSMDDDAVAELRAAGSYGPHLKEYRRTDGTRLTVEVTAAVISDEPLSWVTFIRDPAAEADGETLADSAERLAALAAELARDVAVTDVARTLTRHVRQAMGALGATIMEVDPAAQSMRPVLVEEIPGPIAQAFATFGMDLDTQSTRAWRERQMGFYPDPETIDQTFPHLAAVRAASAVRSCMAVPLVAGDEITGVLTVYWSTPRQLSTAERSFTDAVAGYAAQALARAQLFEAERAARGRLQALQAVMAGLATAVTSEQIAEVLVKEGMGIVAVHGVVAVLDPSGDHLRTWTTANFPADIAQAYARVPIWSADNLPVGWTIRTGQTLVLASLEEITERFPQVAFTHEATGTASVLSVPVQAGGRTIGALAFGFGSEGPPGGGVIQVAGTLAGLAGQALERAQLYEAEHAAAHLLQQALLPQIPAELPGVSVGAFYRPAEESHDVGGDWYDVFELPGGTIGCAVGDVVGHDLAAAAAMGRLQLLLRYTALSGAGPAGVLDALDQACPDLTGTDLATVAYAEYDPAAAGGPTLTYACAGHPPPLLADGGTVRFLDGGRSRALGFRGPRTQARITVPRGARLILYTDGLIERRRQPIDNGFERLARAVAELPAGDPRASCDRLLTVLTGGQPLADDVAVACIDLNGPA
jgi:PAS domain S-box-containing protein